MIILGLESSCDETAAAVLKTDGRSFTLLANIVSSQIAIHKKYGGVVPEVAARNHIKNIIPVIDECLAAAKIKPQKIDRLAVTVGPGLITSLMVGAETAKNLAYAWHKPICGINHMRAHLYANWLENPKLKFPAVCLIVSGGHTELILLKNQKSLKKIGQTVDDAAGEAFDKVAQLLNLGYPGGPVVSKWALNGNPKAFNFARPMLHSKDYNFSFSGLKTSVLYTVKKLPSLKANSAKLKADICASFQQAVVDVLVHKTIKAALDFNAQTVMLSGGVAANQLLRDTCKLKAESSRLNFNMPQIKNCTDNGAMIAAAGYFAQPIPWQKLRVDPNLSI